MARFLFGPINKLNGGGKMGRVANRNLITGEQIDLRKQLECINAPGNNIVEAGTTPTSPIGSGASISGGGSTNTTPSGDGTYQLSTDPSAGIPILYGQCQVRGSVFDSEMTSNGTILTTALMLTERTGSNSSEHTGNANYQLNEVFFNDANLNLNADGTVANAILNDGTVSTKYNTNTKVFLYQGDVDNKLTRYIMGGQNVAPSYGTARTYMQNWANTQVQARGTVFALVQQTYDAANGVQGLGTWTFDITNNGASNPGDVMNDFLTNERYGSQYPATSINSDTLVGTGVDSLKSIANETRLFMSSIADDNANISAVNIANATLYPQLATTGGIGNLTYSNVLIASSSVNGDVTGNLRFSGNNTIRTSANSEIFSRGVNRLKVFWANAATQGANCTNIISGNSSTAPNTFTGFVDIARLIPDGANISGYTFADANINTGKMFPGDTYALSNTNWQGGTADTITIDSALTPTATITNLLVEGDKIRPEGSPFVYTVASNVNVTGAGYKQFSIPVKERIVVPDFANIDMGNATLKTQFNIQPSTFVEAKRFQFDNDDIGILNNNGWPFTNANVATATRFPTTANMTQHANLLYSNVLVGNAIMTTPNTVSDTIVLGEEKNMTINGLIKTDKTVQDIQKQILKHSGCMLNWELPEGRWKAIPNANANITGAKTYNDDNIVGEIKVTTSDITTYYNSARAQYVEKNHNSVKEDIIVYTPNFELNTNESKHKMELNYGLCDSASEAQRKADVELKQNRLDKVINFKSDYTGLGVEPGDIIKVTNTEYGFTDKTFRAVRVRETMDGDILLLNITAIEWTNETYVDRIPFRKPALDDIEFEPEEYSDFIINEEMLAEDIKLSGVLLSKFIGNDQSGSATGGSTLLDLGGVHEFTADKLGATIRNSSESFLLTSFMMPQGTYNLASDGVTPSSLFTVRGRLIAYVSNATSNVATTGNIAIGAVSAPPPTQLSLRIDVPKDVSNIKVRVQGAIDGPFNGTNPAGFDEIGILGLRENT